MKKEKRSLTREERRRRREHLTGGAVLLGCILLALSADGWVGLLLSALEVWA